MSLLFLVLLMFQKRHGLDQRFQDALFKGMVPNPTAMRRNVEVHSSGKRLPTRLIQQVPFHIDA